MPEIYDDMVECDTCGDWYHLKCVSLEQFPVNNGTAINVSSDFCAVVAHKEQK